MLLIHNFPKCIGIEYLEKLHIIAFEILNKFDNDIQELKNNNTDIISDKISDVKILLYNDDFLKHDWSNTSFMFANSTCFSYDLMDLIAEKANKELKPGAIVVTFTKKLFVSDDKWEIKQGFRRVMSWGIATIYIHRKIAININL